MTHSFYCVIFSFQIQFEGAVRTADLFGGQEVSNNEAFSSLVHASAHPRMQKRY